MRPAASETLSAIHARSCRKKCQKRATHPTYAEMKCPSVSPREANRLTRKAAWNTSTSASWNTRLGSEIAVRPRLAAAALRRMSTRHPAVRCARQGRGTQGPRGTRLGHVPGRASYDRLNLQPLCPDSQMADRFPRQGLSVTNSRTGSGVRENPETAPRSSRKEGPEACQSNDCKQD